MSTRYLKLKDRRQPISSNIARQKNHFRSWDVYAGADKLEAVDNLSSWRFSATPT